MGLADSYYGMILDCDIFVPGAEQGTGNWVCLRGQDGRPTETHNSNQIYLFLIWLALFKYRQHPTIWQFDRNAQQDLDILSNFIGFIRRYSVYSGFSKFCNIYHYIIQYRANLTICQGNLTKPTVVLRLPFYVFIYILYYLYLVFRFNCYSQVWKVKVSWDDLEANFAATKVAPGPANGITC